MRRQSRLSRSPDGGFNRAVNLPEERMAENLDVVGFDLEENELKDIAALDLCLHFNDPGVYLPGRPLRLFTLVTGR